ncbi:MAG: Uma2 family endonuclease [Saprospiraceae bacterium]|nr:Uma2 family endonuclease [Saprospiraceae bacterium]
MTHQTATVPSRVLPGVAFQLPDGGMTDDQFYRFCLLNPDLRIERTWDKFIVIIPPTNSETGNLNFELSTELGIWNRRTQLGVGFDSSTGFKLPNGADRSPDLAWIRRERWDALPKEEKRRFAPIVPDFVIEIRSPDQSLTGLKDKMSEYLSNGCLLGWLIDPQQRLTWVYRPEEPERPVDFSQLFSGHPVLPGFELTMGSLWQM